MESNNNNSKTSIIIGVIIVVLILAGLGSCVGGNSSSSSSGEVRCWYCSKVIYNNERAIHCTHKSLNTYTCDYCGTDNVIK